MMNNSDKVTNVYTFLKAVPHLKAMNRHLVLKLAERFKISPESFSILINVAANGGAYYEN